MVWYRISEEELDLIFSFLLHQNRLFLGENAINFLNILKN